MILSRGGRPTIVVVFFLVLAAGAAVAPDLHAQAAIPDLVRLRDGGMLRGTILELVPNDHVTILLSTGETRRIEAASISFAGPANEAPAPPQALPPPPPAEPLGPVMEASMRRASGGGMQSMGQGYARLRLVSDQDEVTFHRVIGSSTASVGLLRASGTHFERLCTAPCEAETWSHGERLALSKGNGDPIAADDVVEINGNTTLRGQYNSRLGVRAVGVGAMILGNLIGLVLIYSSTGGDTLDNTPLYAGLGVCVVSSLVGLIMLNVRDSVSIDVQ